MHRPLTKLCIPFLAILVLAWGTCPCLYVKILSGGHICSDVSPACNCTGSRDSGTDGSCGDEELAASARGGPQTGRCPCLETVGTMHELPQTENQDLCAADYIYLVSEPVILDVPAYTAAGPDSWSSSADPGPMLQSVVLLV